MSLAAVPAASAGTRAPVRAGGMPGTPVTLRPVRPDDLARAIDFAARLSDRSRYQRFLSPRHPSVEELRGFTMIDRRREAALVATVGGGPAERQVGVARLVDLPGMDAAEFAIVVADDWQGRGLGRALLEALVRLAHERGTLRLVGTTLSENSAMLGLARKLGFRTHRQAGSGYLTELTLDLTQGLNSH